MRSRTLAWLAGVATLAIGLALLWPPLPWQGASPPKGEKRFARWRASQPDAGAYFDYLRQQGVAEVLPPEQLLRLGRRWQVCGGGEFAVPPRALWPRIVPTLKLVAELRKAGLLEHARVASAWRPPDFNKCEGGSSASRHLENVALDLDLATPEPRGVQGLCQRWKQIGPDRRWGLGFYSPTQIHLDTAGFRTWGFDYHRASSLCMTPG